MGDHFDFQKLRIQQPGKLLSTRANYEIFNDRRQLLATATETEAHHRLKVISKAMPDTRVLAVTTADGTPILTLIKQTSVWITDLHDPDGELFGRIRTSGTRRQYTFLDDQDEIVARAEGDLALKHFTVKGTAGEFARVRKTWAGLTKEMLTASDHYKVDFTGPVPAATRTLTVMMPIVLDLTLYGPT